MGDEETADPTNEEATAGDANTAPEIAEEDKENPNPVLVAPDEGEETPDDGEETPADPEPEDEPDGGNGSPLNLG